MVVSLVLMPLESVAGEKDLKLEFDVFELLRNAPSVHRSLPEGKIVKENGVEYKVYNPTEYAEVVKMEDDYDWFREKFFLLVKAHSIAVVELEKKDSLVEVCEANNKILKSNIGYYIGRNKELKAYNLEIKRSDKVNRILMIGTVALEAVAIVILGIKI